MKVSQKRFTEWTISLIVVFVIFEIVFVPWVFALGVTVGMTISTTIYILNRRLVKTEENPDA